MSKVKSYKSLSGNRVTHFDENGNKIGVSYKSASGKRITHFDANGNKVGTSWGNNHGRYRHYDSNGVKTGTSYVRPSGLVRNFDEKGNYIGTSHQGFISDFVTNTQSKSHTPPNFVPAKTEPDSYFPAVVGCLSPFLIFAFAALLAAFKS